MTCTAFVVDAIFDGFNRVLNDWPCFYECIFSVGGLYVCVGSEIVRCCCNGDRCLRREGLNGLKDPLPRRRNLHETRHMALTSHSSGYESMVCDLR